MRRIEEAAGKAQALVSRYKKLIIWMVLLIGAGLLVSGVIVSVAPYFVWLRLRHFSNTLALQSGMSPNFMLGVVIVATIPFF